MRVVPIRAQARGRARKTGRPVPGARLRGLRWVPVPLALLAAMLGLLVMGTMQGRAAADLAKEPNQAGGLSLSVDTMLWMMNMSTSSIGSGASTDVTPGSKNSSGGSSSAGGYQMPASMMPGMQAAGDNRLRVEVDLSNVSASVQRYSTTDFSLSGPGGKTWKVNGQEHSTLPVSANLQPGFSTTVDVYFDIPASDAKHLTLHWSRGGRTISMPVNTSGTGPSEMPGM
jgi:uncharacterized protein DUF4352